MTHKFEPADNLKAKLKDRLVETYDGKDALLYLKFVEKEEYANDFICGKLWMSSSQDFRCTNESQLGRYDERDGTTEIKKQKKLKPTIKLVKENGESIVGYPESVKFCDDSSIFCFAGISIDEFDILYLPDQNGYWGYLDWPRDFISLMKEIFQSKYMVVFPSIAFNEIMMNRHLRFKKVRYMHSEFDYIKNDDDFIFLKNAQYEDQKEYRIALNNAICKNHIYNLGCPIPNAIPFYLDDEVPGHLLVNIDFDNPLSSTLWCPQFNAL